MINVDTKLLSKVFANRVKRVLPEIIHTDQKGCVQGRFIGQNIRLVEDIINEMDDDKIILMLDQEKAFDKIEWDWLFKVLHTFSFGDRFIQWIKTMYKHMKCAVETNGYVSEYLSVTRGIRQGDSLSALLYVIQSEPLAQYIRISDSIKGIPLIDFEKRNIYQIKSCQYVDDTNVMLNNTNEVQECIKIIDDFGKASGSSLNKSKTKGISKKPREWEYEGITMSPAPLISLGIPVGHLKDMNVFWTKNIENIKKKLNIWQTYDLSLIGKVYVIKSIGLSQIMYHMEMTDIDMKYLQKISDSLWHFLWNGKRMIIKKDICFLPRLMGGLGLPDIEILKKVKRIKMLIGILKDKDAWCVLAQKYICVLDRSFGKMPWFSLCANNSSEEISKSNIPLFYKDCILAYQELCRKGRKLCVWDNLLWCNDKIKQNGKVLSYKHWADCGILWLSDLGENGVNHDYKPGILDRLRFKAGFIFEYKKLEKSVKYIAAEQFVTNQTFPDTYDEVAKQICQTKFEVPDKGLKSFDQLHTSEIYSILLLNQQIKIPSVEYWNQKFPNEHIDFDLWYRILFTSKICDRKCLDFNWKIFHGLLNTGQKLKAMGYSNGLCVVCGDVMENTQHLLVDCRYVTHVWKTIENKMLKFEPNCFSFSTFNKIVGILRKGESFEVVNMILGIVRWEIWKSRCRTMYENDKMKHDNILNHVLYSIKCHINTLIKSKGLNGRQQIDKLQRII